MTQSRPSRYGKIDVSHTLIFEDYETVSKVFSKICFLPVRAESLYHRDCIEYEGYCPKFEELPLGSEIPKYELEVTKVNGKLGKVNVLKW